MCGTGWISRPPVDISSFPPGPLRRWGVAWEARTLKQDSVTTDLPRLLASGKLTRPSCPLFLSVKWRWCVVVTPTQGWGNATVKYLRLAGRARGTHIGWKKPLALGAPLLQDVCPPHSASWSILVLLHMVLMCPFLLGTVLKSSFRHLAYFWWNTTHHLLFTFKPQEAS